MFHFPTFPPHTLYIQVQVTRHHSCWVSPFGHPRITARLTAPRGLSQPPTSFIGSWCQGIHRTLFITYNKDARVHCAVLKQHTRQDLPHPPDTPHTTNMRNTGMRYSLTVYSFLPRKNTRVFSQDPTVHRYRTSGTTLRKFATAGSGCQCSTHERPPDQRMWSAWSLRGFPPTCVGGTAPRCAP